MKTALFTVIAGLLAWHVSAQEVTFQGMPFGSTSGAFIEKLGKPSHTWTPADKEMLGNLALDYEGIEVAGHTAEMEAEFRDDRLIGGAYSFSLEQKRLVGGAIDPTIFVNTFLDLEKKLEIKYGKPYFIKLPDPIEGDGVSGLVAQEMANSEGYGTSWLSLSRGGVILFLQFTNGAWDLKCLYESPELVQKTKADADAKKAAEDTKKNDTSGL